MAIFDIPRSVVPSRREPTSEWYSQYIQTVIDDPANAVPLHLLKTCVPWAYEVLMLPDDKRRRQQVNHLRNALHRLNTARLEAARHFAAKSQDYVSLASLLDPEQRDAMARSVTFNTYDPDHQGLVRTTLRRLAQLSGDGRDHLDHMGLSQTADSGRRRTKRRSVASRKTKKKDQAA